MPWRMLRPIVRVGILTEPPPQPLAPQSPAGGKDEAEQRAIREEFMSIFGPALAIRQVDPGTCNGCGLEMHALNNLYYNIEGLGIKFVVGPRHADLLLVTGPVSAHMDTALRRTYEAMPAPKLVVAVGECGCNGGVFGESYASRGRVANILPVDVEVGGCPPAPGTG